MIIEFEDIKLRAVEEEDLEMIREMINDPNIERMTGGGSFPVSKYMQEQWFRNLQSRSGELRLIIDTKKHGAVGTIILTDIDTKDRTAQIHCKLAKSKKAENKGYCTKAITALVKYAFEQMNLHCIYSQVVAYNAASIRVMEKCGFQKEGVLRDRTYYDGQYHNDIVFSIIRESTGEQNG